MIIPGLQYLQPLSFLNLALRWKQPSSWKTSLLGFIHSSSCWSICTHWQCCPIRTHVDWCATRIHFDCCLWVVRGSAAQKDQKSNKAKIQSKRCYEHQHQRHEQIHITVPMDKSLNSQKLSGKQMKTGTAEWQVERCYKLSAARMQKAALTFLSPVASFWWVMA